MAMSTLNQCATPSLLCMPNEVLVEIFQLIPGLSALPAEKALLRLCAVCRVFNAIIKETPSLWTTIQIDARTPDYRIPLTKCDAELLFPTLNVALIHSRPMPLDVEFTAHRDEDHWQRNVDRFSVNICERLMALVLTQAHRIRSFNMKGTAWEHHLVVSDALAQCRNLPILRRWEQECDTSSRPAAEYSVLVAGAHRHRKGLFLSDSLGKAAYVPPLLQVVSIRSSVYDWSKFACTGVTELRLGKLYQDWTRPTTRELIAILAGVKDTLEILELSNMLQFHGFEANHPLGEPLVLSSVSTFRLTYTTAPEVITFLPYITMPNLCKFSLKACNSEGRGMTRVRDPDTKALLLTVMAVIRLEKIRDLTLERVSFWDTAPNSPLSREQWEMKKSTIPEHDLPLALQFMRRLQSLEHLHVRASRTFSKYADYPGALRIRKA